MILLEMLEGFLYTCVVQFNTWKECHVVIEPIVVHMHSKPSFNSV